MTEHEQRQQRVAAIGVDAERVCQSLIARLNASKAPTFNVSRDEFAEIGILMANFSSIAKQLNALTEYAPAIDELAALHNEALSMLILSQRTANRLTEIITRINKAAEDARTAETVDPT